MAQAGSGSSWWLSAGAAGGIVGVVITGLFNHFDNAGDLDAKMVELTVSILRSKPNPETMPLREWAIDTLQTRAHFKFTADQIAVLKNQTLPNDFQPYDSSFSPGFDRSFGPATRHN
jgi:hypothetical protein